MTISNLTVKLKLVITQKTFFYNLVDNAARCGRMFSGVRL